MRMEVGERLHSTGMDQVGFGATAAMLVGFVAALPVMRAFVLQQSAVRPFLRTHPGFDLVLPAKDVFSSMRRGALAPSAFGGRSEGRLSQPSGHGLLSFIAVVAAFAVGGTRLHIVARDCQSDCEPRVEIDKHE